MKPQAVNRQSVSSLDLQRLIASLPQTVAGIEVVTGLRERSPHQTYCLTLANGERIKARSLGDPLEATRVASLLPCLPPQHFPQLLGWLGEAVLEPWILGTALSTAGASDSLLSRCGEILGQVHHVQPPAGSDTGTRSIGSWLRHFDEELEHLLRFHMLANDEAAELRQMIAKAPSTVGLPCLVHRDFCAENIVLVGNRPVSIDNMSLRIGHPTEDLCRTFYRWPMTTRQWQCFLAGYRSRGDTRDFDSYGRFWISLVMVHAIYYQSSIGSVRTAETLNRLKGWIRNDSSAGLPAI